MKVNCIVCNTEFNITPSKRLQSITGEFCCSKECSSKKRNLGQIAVNCGHCDKNFSVKKSIIEKSATKIFYCSKKCFWIFMANKKNNKQNEKYSFTARKLPKLNCKSKDKDFIAICPDDYKYSDFIKKAKAAYCNYHLDKNNSNIAKTALKIGIERTYLYVFINENKKELINNTGIGLTKLKFAENIESFIYNKKRNFDRQEKIRIAKKDLLPLSEEELYTSMLPQYLYYMNIRESEYDKSDLIRLPLLIQHYKDINAEDKVEDLEEILEIIKNKL